MDDFLNLEDLSEEEIAQLMEMGALDDQMGILDKQLAQATALRNAPGPEGRDSGRVYTAANPLEHLVHAAQGIQAGSQMEDLAKKQEAILGQQTSGRKAFLDALRRRPKVGLGPMPGEDMGVY